MPLDIELHSSAPNGKNHHVEIVFLSDVIVNVSPAAIRAVTATTSAIPPPKVSQQLSTHELKQLTLKCRMFVKIERKFVMFCCLLL